MSLIFNSIQSMFWQCMSQLLNVFGMCSFSPAGTGTVSPSHFYDDDMTVVMKSKPSGCVTAVWEIGQPVATVYVYKDEIDFYIFELGTFQNNEGVRKTTYDLIQEFIDTLDRIYVYVDGDSWDNVSTISIGLLNRAFSGLYKSGEETIFMQPDFSSGNFWDDPNFYNQLMRDNVLIHELRHAVDKNKWWLTLNQKEQNAYKANCQYLVVMYAMDEYTYNRGTIYSIWENSKRSYVDLYGGNADDLVWPFPDE